jgi:hypothetical protein
MWLYEHLWRLAGDPQQEQNPDSWWRTIYPYLPISALLGNNTRINWTVHSRRGNKAKARVAIRRISISSCFSNFWASQSGIKRQLIGIKKWYYGKKCRCLESRCLVHPSWSSFVAVKGRCTHSEREREKVWDSGSPQSCFTLQLWYVIYRLRILRICLSLRVENRMWVLFFDVFLYVWGGVGWAGWGG